jgi:hypothetical protein
MARAYAKSFSSLIGSSRTRMPVAWWTVVDFLARGECSGTRLTEINHDWIKGAAAMAGSAVSKCDAGPVLPPDLPPPKCTAELLCKNRGRYLQFTSHD